MQFTKITVLVLGQFLATAALAQTTDTATDDAMQGSFGSDWSPSLGAALIGEDGMTARPADDIRTQWETLSDADKEMIRRDCAALMDRAADTTTTTEGTATTTESGITTETGTTTETDSTADTGTTSDSETMEVTDAQMQAICDATTGL
jgi:hypothetical protein